MVYNSMNNLNKSKTIYIPIKVACIIYGFFTCVLSLFGVIILALARSYIFLITVIYGVTKTKLFVGYYDEAAAELGGRVEDISLDFTSEFLNWETVPISGYGIVFYACFVFSVFYSVVLCYGIHVRNARYLNVYLVYGVSITACMILAFFYIYAWFTEYRLYSIIAAAMALYVHLVIRRIVKTLHLLFFTEAYNHRRSYPL